MQFVEEILHVVEPGKSAPAGFLHRLDGDGVGRQWPEPLGVLGLSHPASADVLAGLAARVEAALVADQVVHFGGTQEGGVDPDMLLPVEAGVREGDLHEVAHGMADAGGDDASCHLSISKDFPR